MTESKASKSYMVLPSKAFYEELNSEVTVKVEQQWEKIKDLILQYPKVKDICDKLKRNLDSMDIKPQSDLINKKRCYDLNYWLLEEVSNKLNIKEDHPDFYDIIDKIHIVWKDINNGLIYKSNICMPDSTLMDMEVLKQFKELFDYVEDYKTNLVEAIYRTSSACEKNIGYLNRIIPMYYANKSFCTNPETNICNKYIDNYEEYDPKNIGKYLKWTDVFWKIMMYPCYQKVIKISLSAQTQPQRVDVKYRAPKKVETSVVAPLPISEPYVQDQVTKESKNSPTNHFLIILIVFTLGQLLAFLLLYKKTHDAHQRKNKKKTWNNDFHEDVLLIGDTDSLQSDNSQDSSYILQYQSF
ncbi:variable surface protein [Plasmodium gonderi]|uniref:Variable surface protein n=1 Tax=Plasmodium gonderi TaxID=77519 RepID=A0A1Y1JFV2_PLAGO|nr:variable surface protein [Plasmodium gonderi]GAW80087.1 variable surface protein [Plasmodium gonderi]